MSESVITQNNNSLDDNLSATEPTVDPNKNDIKDNGDAQEESSPPKKLKLSNDVKDEVATLPILSKGGLSARAGRPSKAATAKRLNILEKTAKEGEAMLQNMGHKADDDLESNRRRTRSQTRGTPAVAPTLPKKEKIAPKTPTKQETPVSSGTPRRRGRPPKNSVANNSVESKTEVNTKSGQKKEKSEPMEETESQEKTVNNNSNETNNNNSNDGNASDESNSDEQPSKDAIDGKPAAPESVANEQTNDLSAKTNSISGDTSKSVPVLDSQQPTAD